MPLTYVNPRFFEWQEGPTDPTDAYRTFEAYLLDDGHLEITCANQRKDERDARMIEIVIGRDEAPDFLVGLHTWIEQLAVKTPIDTFLEAQGGD